jgi:hypothetical protein
MRTIDNHDLQVDPEEERTQLRRVSGFFRGEWLNLWPVWVLGIVMFVIILWLALRL